MALEKLGPYRLTKVLGRGGMGAVYIGETEQNERAAIKVLSPALSDEPGFRERFKGEVETLKRLLHPNIVQLFGFGEDDGHLFYSMELVEGRSLQEELSAGRRFHWREAARIGIEVAKALKHAHDRGIVHRDLKPANLMIDSHDHIKLTDFGIAKLYGGTNITSDGGVLGTADYMSPEQAEGKQVSSRCDLYSLGSVLYALLSGKPPFAGKSLPEVIHRLRFEEAIPIHRIAPDTPDEFALIIGQLLEKDPQRRIATAMAVANRLRAMEHALSMETQVGPLPSPAVTPLTVVPSMPTGGVASTDMTAIHTKQSPANATAALADITKLQASGVSGSMPTLVPGAPNPLAAAAVAPAIAPQTPKATHFTTVTEADLRRNEQEADAEEGGLASILKMAALLLLVAGILGFGSWYLFQPASANQLYQRIEPAISSGDPQQLLAKERDIQRFLETYPEDERVPTLRSASESLDLYRLEKRFDFRARMNSLADGSDPAEQWYLQAIALAKTDPAKAEQRFRAIINVLGDSTAAQPLTNERKAILVLCQKQLDRLVTAASAIQQKEEAILDQQLALAQSLASSDPEQSSRIASGLLTLYSDKPWAADRLSTAKSLVNSSPVTKSE